MKTISFEITQWSNEKYSFKVDGVLQLENIKKGALR